MMSSNADPLNLVVCGTGGQGNILISRMIGRILFRNGYYVTIGETFGAAQRGGAVHSNMRISRKRYYGPLIPKGKAHVILSLEPLETLRAMAAYGNEDVMIVSNTEPVHPVAVLTGRTGYPDLKELKHAVIGLSKEARFLDVTAIAADLGEPIVANIVLLGALLGVNQIPLTVEDVEGEIRSTFPESKVQLNLKALEMGMERVKAA